ncbi:MAG: DegT/DnrJ/EryC1/StrS family aminotransferase, partial [Candidatus Omnitrophica bacterium]|nr:DegT/DnrJ/EryC1/StrS family aminotransferase [Candidatus Omnitrophota bacterium]
GAITTNDDDLYRKLKLMINFGIQDEEHVVEVGLNAKMPEMNVIFGLIGLERIKKIIDKLACLNAIYKKRLSGIPGIKFQKIREGCRTNNQYMAIEIIPEDFGLTRDMVHRVLKEDNVIARKYFFPVGYSYDCYKGMDFARGIRLPNTEKVSSRILCLPVYYSLDAKDVEKICDLIESIYVCRKEIARKLK